MIHTDINWLHLSDFHVGKDDYSQIDIMDKIIEEVSCVSQSGNKPDFVFITGDIANKGLSAEMALFDKKFLEPLLTCLGDDHFNRVFIVPGNHDVDRRESRSVRRYDVLDDVKEFLDPTPDGQKERELLIKRFEAFDNQKWFLEYSPWIGSSFGFSTRILSIGSASVGVVSINTAWFCGGEHEKERLDPGIGMLEAGLKEVKECYPIFVLGHHPLDWFAPSRAKTSKSLLAKFKAIYLHGHLHKSEHSSQFVGLNLLTTIQAGCAFFARDDEEWRTRILWGGYSLAKRKIFLQPKMWMPEHSEWILDADAFPNSLRIPDGDYWVIPAGGIAPPGQEMQKSGHKQVSAPDGWVTLDYQYLQDRRQAVSEERILQYFEGRVPQWEEILSGAIPARAIVEDLVSTISHGFGQNEVHFTLLSGAGGEGKSTAFLQTLERLVPCRNHFPL